MLRGTGALEGMIPSQPWALGGGSWRTKPAGDPPSAAAPPSSPEPPPPSPDPPPPLVAGTNVAQSVRSLWTTNSHGPLPLHSPPQPSNVQPLSATGTNDTCAPACPGASQAARQSRPSAWARTVPLPLMRTEMGYAAEPPSPPVPASPLLPPPSVPPPPAPDPPPAVLPMLDPQALDRRTASVPETRRPSVMTSPAHERAPTTTSTSWGPNA